METVEGFCQESLTDPFGALIDPAPLRRAFESLPL
jgi:hypothetical protein